MLVLCAIDLLFCDDFEGLGDFLVDGLVGIYPIYCVTSAFHTSKPCHLAFGELVDCGFEPLEHFVVGEFADEVLGEEFVF